MKIICITFILVREVELPDVLIYICLHVHGIFLHMEETVIHYKFINSRKRKVFFIALSNGIKLDHVY